MFASTTIAALNSNSGAIQALATVVLVLITIYSSYVAWRALREVSNTRKDSRLPILRVGINGPIEGGGPGIREFYVSVLLKNVGYGIARHITITLPHHEPVFVRSLNKDKRHHQPIILQEGGAERLKHLPDQERIITVEYVDIFSRKIKTVAPFKDAEENDWITFEVTQWDPILPE